jgi:hypothetical protein
MEPEAKGSMTRQGITTAHWMVALTLSAVPTAVLAQPDSPWGFWSKWGDQNDGTYRNPVMPADFSDLDAIRVGRDYFAISSTIHLSPGMAVLKSSDMVNWQLIGHVVPDLTVLGPEYRWDRMERFGRGVWAGTIRHHANKFWVFFGTPDEGFFVSTAENPAGPWTPLHPLLKGAGWDDCTVLWDDDGQAYFLGTHFAEGYKSYIMPMSADGRSIDRSRAVLVNEGEGREASKLLKYGGWYYLVFSREGPIRGRSPSPSPDGALVRDQAARRFKSWVPRAEPGRHYRGAFGKALLPHAPWQAIVGRTRSELVAGELDRWMADHRPARCAGRRQDGMGRSEACSRSQASEPGRLGRILRADA